MTAIHLPYRTYKKVQVILAFLCIFWSGFSSELNAQAFGNEWINFSQEYYKIPLVREGIYRLDYEDLQDAGFPVDQVNPKKIQLFHRGQEQAIYIYGEADARFDTGDYLLFYGTGNDGQQDEELYADAEGRLNPYYSLFSDSTAYFLTWVKDSSSGLRMTTNNSENNVTGMTAEPYHWAEALQVFINHYSRGQFHPRGIAGSETLLSQYDKGEGWTGPFVQHNQTRDFTLTDLTDIYAGVAPELTLRLAGRNNQKHAVEVLVGPDVSSLRSLETITFDYFGGYVLDASLNTSDIAADGSIVIRMKVNGVNGKADAVSMTSIRLRYPQAIDMGGETKKSIHLRPDADGKSYIELKNVVSGTLLWDVSEPGNVIRITNPVSGGEIHAVISNTTTRRELLASSVISTVPQIRKVTFRNIDPSIYNYLIVSHTLLRQAVDNVIDPVQAYADYRSGTEGGGYTPLIVNMQELYDQFSYGERSPLAIRRFAAYMLEGGEPAFLFLIGKGITFEDAGVAGSGQGQNTFLRKEAVVGDYQNLVPSYGEPGSDIAITAGLWEHEYAPAIPTGRLSVTKPDEVLHYLNKVKEMEGLPFNALWRKNLLHLSGGQSTEEVNLFKLYMDNFKERAEQTPYWAGQVTTLKKQTSSSVELINIADKVNEGLGMITFFGHASANLVDIEIGLVSDPLMGYQNQGKYPFIMVNGCNTGDIFNTNYNFTDDWMLSPELGAIGFLAHSNVGFSPLLRSFTDIFYQTAFNDSVYISRALGEIQQEAIIRYRAYKGGFLTEKDIAQMQQMVLQGDPAIRLFGDGKPDYASSSDDILLEAIGEQRVTAESDSFRLGIITRNYGVALPDSLTVGISRVFGDGNLLAYDTMKFAPVGYKDTLWVTLQNESGVFEPAGVNSFTIQLDYAQAFEESDETNNQVTFNYLMGERGVANLLPLDFAVINTTQADLWVEHRDRLAINQRYEIQLDTLPAFDSPFRRDTLIQAHSLAHWPLTLADKDQVYYWRSKLEGQDEWSLHTFSYQKDSEEGWGQMDNRQLAQNESKGLLRFGSQWTFRNEQVNLEVLTHGAEHAESGSVNSMVNIDGLPLIVNASASRICRYNSLNFVAFEEKTKEPYAAYARNTHEVLDNRRCGRVPQVINNFVGSEITGSAALVSEYMNAVPDGDYVLVFTIGTVNFDAFPDLVKSELEKIGADRSLLDGLQNGQPYILFGQKGAGSATAIELTGAAGDLIQPADPVKLDINFETGTFYTDKIGPAAAWKKVKTKLNAFDAASDYVYYDVIGLTADQQEVVLANEVAISEFDLSAFSAEQYPYLKLKWVLTDTVNATAPQPEALQVEFVNLPEGVIYPAEAEHAKLSGLQKQEGEKDSLTFIYKNISAKGFSDSLDVIYSIQTVESRSSDSTRLRIASPAPLGETLFKVGVNSLGKSGTNNLFVTANASALKEVSAVNNKVFWTPFMEVKADETHPVLDVTFDGQYILDGDIVSPEPMITILVKDENSILQKKDTVGLDVLLQDLSCESCLPQRIRLTDPQIKWFPAEGEQDFRVEFEPKQLEDGKYKLIVQAQDGSGNQSGVKPYQVTFEVVSKSQISHFYPYPNPFSTSTRFVFTLTGFEIPDEIKIQIMTVTGKVVREITQEELGPVRIGHNLTEYAWDGRDEYGDLLANGVYLYRVILRNKGQEMERRATAADERAFKKDFGKLYILR